MVMRSNLRWCSDGLEFTCWNGEVIRLAFIIDAFDREIIAWTAVANAGISALTWRDMMLEAVEKRFRGNPSPAGNRASLGQWFCLHREGHEAVCQALNLTPCFTPWPVRSQMACRKPSSKP